MVQAKIHLHKIEHCDANADYPIKFNLRVKGETGMQVVEEGNVSTKIPLGNNIMVSPNRININVF